MAYNRRYNPDALPACVIPVDSVCLFLSISPPWSTPGDKGTTR